MSSTSDSELYEVCDDENDEGQDTVDTDKMSSTEEIKRLRAARGQCKSFITRLESYFIETQEHDQDELEARELQLHEQYKRFQDLQVQLLCLDEKDDESGPFEERYFRLCALLKRRKQAAVSECDKISVKSNAKSIKLPKINIQPYDGRDISGFQPFMDLFGAIIGEDAKLSSIEKLYYLKTLLKGEPLQIIEGLPVSNGSFNSAIQLLTKRYSNPSLVITTHINILLDMPSIQRGTAQQLREMTAKIRQQISALENLKQPTDKWDAILMCIVTRKLDPLTVRLFHSEKDYATTMPSLYDLLEFLDKRAVALEVSPMYNDKSKSKSVNLAGVIDPRQTATSSNCTICNDSHRLYKCPKFVLMSIDKKLAHVNKHKHCVICLGLHSQKCRYQFKCTICKSKDHNTLLHVDGKQDGNKEDQSVSLYSYKVPQTKVLLQTVKFLVSDANGKKIVARGLLDSGSQASLCTSRLADRLDIQPFQHEKNISSP